MMTNSTRAVDEVAPVLFIAWTCLFQKGIHI